MSLVKMLAKVVKIPEYLFYNLRKIIQKFNILKNFIFHEVVLLLFSSYLPV